MCEVQAETEWILPQGSRKGSPSPKSEATGIKTEESMEVDSYSGRAESGRGSADGLTSRTGLAAMKARRQAAGKKGTAVPGADA